MKNRSRVIGFGSAMLLVAAGLAGGIGFGGTFGQILALVLTGLGFMLATAFVFLEVGLSEDRERAREEAEKADAQPRRQDRPPLQRQRRRGHRGLR